MSRLITYFRSLTLKQLLAHLFFSFAIILNAMSALFDFIVERNDFALVQTIVVIINAALLVHYLKYKNLRFATFGLSIVYSLEFLTILYLENFALHAYFFPIFLPLIAYLTLSLKESTIITLIHYTAIALISFYAYGILHIQSQAFTGDAILTYFVSTLFIILFGLYYHLTIVDDYYKLYNSNLQKEMILGEIHHRIKNNLSVISSMFGIQMMGNDQKDIQAIIEKNRNRIETIVKIHDTLYKKENLKKVEFEAYVEELLDYLFSLSEFPVNLKLKIEKHYFSSVVMQQFGIIIHELVTNSIKYAFDHHSKNVITISLKKEGDEFLFTYSDNGKGYCQNDVDCYNKIHMQGSLGLNLIALATKQLGGKLDFDGRNGVTFNIRFPKDQVAISA